MEKSKKPQSPSDSSSFEDVVLNASTVAGPGGTLFTFWPCPGESAVVRIDYGQSNLQRDVVWAGRGDRWVVTQIIYAARSRLVAVKVVNISDKTVWIDTRALVARVVEFGSFPVAGRFARPGLRRYKEWQVMIYESTNSRGLRKRERHLARIQQCSEPPCVQTPDYPWPKKLLTRPPVGSEHVHMVRLQPEPGAKLEKSRPAQTGRLSEAERSRVSDKERDAVSVGKDDTVESSEIVDDGRPDSEDPEMQLEPIKDSEESPDEGSSSDSDEFYDAISFDDEYLTERPPESPSETEPQVETRSELSREARDGVPKLHAGERRRAMLPDLQELSPKCDIEKADVGEPGRTTPAEDEKLRTCLRHEGRVHRRLARLGHDARRRTRLDATRLGCGRVDALLAQYLAQTEAHQDEEARRATVMLEAL
ncbi:hypothetical protein ON010_g18049 [Phytophthora cinnamomi]|nr:hypothetical protein ON010_g18049 [Phytophthora cinnamomi]